MALSTCIYRIYAGLKNTHGPSAVRPDFRMNRSVNQTRSWFIKTMIAAFAVVCLVNTALADRRVALVVGVSSYAHVPRLENPANDARLMARTLRSLGFEIIGGDAAIDLDKAQFDAALQKFGDAVQGADVGLFYYAGHGVQVAGRNFLVPIDSNPSKESDVYLQMIDTQIVLNQMEGAGTKLNIVLLDACRNSPFGGRGLRAATGGLAQMQAPEGTLISYATQPGNVAMDGADGDSPYTTALAQTLTKPGLGLFDAFNEVGLAVKRKTGGAQQPWVSSSPIEGGFSFASAKASSAPSPSPPSKTGAPDAIVANRSADDVGKAVSAPPASSVPASDRREDSAGACNRLAASKIDLTTPSGVGTVEFADIDPDKAIPACRAALAEKPSDVRIKFQLARALLKGADAQEAISLFRTAAAGGSAAAMEALGFAYENGRNVPKNVSESLAWYRKSADAGNSYAMNKIAEAYRHGDGLRKDPVEALRWSRKSADLGNPAAMAEVGIAYAEGSGVAPNAAEAIRWYRLAAQGGSGLGMHRLGLAYLHGVGVGRDPAEAVVWFRKAAESGNTAAMKNLASAYRDGVGVPRDAAQAAAWEKRAKDE